MPDLIPTPVTSPGAALMRLANGYQRSMALHAAASLGIADRLRDGSMTADALAADLGLHPGALYRLLRALAAEGVFHEDDARAFSLTEMGQCLRSDAATPVGQWATSIGRPYSWQPWACLADSIRTGGTAFEMLHGTDSWTYRAAHPEEGAIFDAAMTALSRDVARAVVAAYDFAPFTCVVDVGGGHGALLGAILAANPHLRGIVFDQAHVVQHAHPVVAALGVEDRCLLASGSFFDEAPEGDLILLKSILHDWDDRRAGAILTTCRKSLAKGGRLLVLERIVAPPNQGPDAKFTDLMMMVGPGGLERTEAEFAALFAAAGFRLVRVLPTASRLSILEAV